MYRIARSSDPLARVTPVLSRAERGRLADRARGGARHAAVRDRARGRRAGARARARRMCAYGRAVARVHQVRPPPLGRPPWLLGALEPGWGGYGWLPVPCRELLLRLAATPAIREGFRSAAAAWRAGVPRPRRPALGQRPGRARRRAAAGLARRLGARVPGRSGVGRRARSWRTCWPPPRRAASRPARLPDVWAPALDFLGGYKSVAALARRASGRGSSGAASRWPESGSCSRSSSTAIWARASSRRWSPSCCRGPSRLLGAPEAIVSELARARGCSCGQ